ncbi:MAG: tetraacyldisaccharide 4'-kinase [Pseudomonadota bacterium]
MAEAPRAGLRGRLERYLNEVWYGDRRPAAWLRLLEGVHGGLARRRTRPPRQATEDLPPIIVVGNLTAGGTGKSPLVIWLAGRARGLCFRPGIISRGHGGRPQEAPRFVDARTDPAEVGDEPVMLARETGVPVVVCRHRLEAARAIAGEVDLIIADDGLQHRALPRAYEIVVRDAVRGFGNGRLLPAGPLREPVDRLESVDLVIDGGSPDGLQLQPEALVHLRTEQSERLDALRNRASVHAVAGIGNPDRFFADLEGAVGRSVVRHAFPDHWAFARTDLADLETACVVMTAKDAVKCSEFAGEDWWRLASRPVLAEPAETAITTWLRSLRGDATQPDASDQHE